MSIDKNSKPPATSVGIEAGGFALSDQEIKEAVARKLGWRQSRVFTNPVPMWEFSDRDVKGVIFATNELPDYCHSIAVAWEMVEWLTSNDFNFNIWKSTPKSVWVCAIAKNPASTQWVLLQELADTAPMAICLAFLKIP